MPPGKPQYFEGQCRHVLGRLSQSMANFIASFLLLKCGGNALKTIVFHKIQCLSYDSERLNGGGRGVPAGIIRLRFAWHPSRRFPAHQNGAEEDKAVNAANHDENRIGGNGVK